MLASTVEAMRPRQGSLPNALGATRFGGFAFSRSFSFPSVATTRSGRKYMLLFN